MKAAVTVLAVAALCLCTWAADNAVVGTSPIATPQSTHANYQPPIANPQALDAITIPQMLSYQGKLTDTFGLPVADTTYSVDFRLYSVPSGGSSFWDETQTVRTRAGLFSTLLGSVTPIGSMPDGGAVYLGMAVAGGAELTPRLRIASAAYAYLSERAANADLLQGRDTTALDARYVNEAQANSVSSAMITNGTIAAADLNQMGASSGQVMKWTGSAWAPRNDSIGDGGGGTVTSVSQATGAVCTPNPITTTGTVGFDQTYGDGRYVNEAQANSVTGAMITDGQVSSADIRDTTVNTADLKNAAVTAPKLNQMGATTNQVLKWTGSAWAPANDSAGAGDNAWVRSGSDSVLYTINQLGIARGGASNVLHGINRFTHVNLGVACATGTNGLSYSYATVGGGYGNIASNQDATVGGGSFNGATGYGATVGGGSSNTASDSSATVGGGDGNTASSLYATVGGGHENDAINDYATVAGGNINTASGTYATVAGGNYNTASSYAATVSGGLGNSASGNYATIGGGADNAADTSYATVGGGASNDATGYYATVGGGAYNVADTNYATVGGGNSNEATGYRAAVGGGYSNNATGEDATVGGGYSNIASGIRATVAGGHYNTASGSFATVSGGYRDSAMGYASGGLSGFDNVAGGAAADTCALVAGGRLNRATAKYATVAGGVQNTACSSYAAVAGGRDNTASNRCATVGGGGYNTASGGSATVAGGYSNTASGTYAMVPGGSDNVARSSYSFAAGRHARANHRGSFVWSDSAVAASESVYTAGANQFRVRARGGTWFFSNTGMTTGAYLAPGSNSWESACDSATKEDFRPVDRRELLEKVASLRVRNYKMKDQDDGTRHIGPVAQDFHNAFGYGGSETGINLADADGVALAAIQALYEQNQALSRRVAELEAKFRDR